MRRSALSRCLQCQGMARSSCRVSRFFIRHYHDTREIDELPLPANKFKYIFNLIFPGKQAHRRAEETVRSTGCLYRIPISKPAMVIVTADPEHVSTTFRNEGEIPVRPGAGPLAGFMEKRGFGKGLVLSDLEEWRALRSKCNQQIVPRKVLEFTPLIYDVAGDVVQYFRDHRGVNNYVDSILEPLMDWAFEAIGIYILGERLNTFTSPSTKMRAFQRAALQYIDDLSPLLTPLPLYTIIPTPSSIRFVIAVRELEEITEGIVEEKMANINSKIDKDAVGFLDQWLLNDAFTREDIYVLVRDFLAAGIDTTSLASTYMLYELARNPDVQERLREEVLSVVGEHNVPTVQHLQKLHFAKNIIMETLRLYPIITNNRRMLDKDVIMDGYKIPKGTWVMIDSYSMSRDPTIFEDPLKFNPDRWTRESKKKNAFAHLPFGFGPRACYGRRLSETELTVLLVKISRNFNLDTDLTHLDYAGTTVIKPTEPVRIQFNDRE